jgi:hypothetical protein
MAKSAKERFAQIGNSLLDAAVFATDLGPMSRMDEIEREIDKLQGEYANLNHQLDSTRRRKTPYGK